MKQYTIPIVWQTWKTFEVDANNLQEAVQKALSQFFSEPCSDGNYLEDSFEIDGIIEDNYPDEEYDLNKAIQLT